MAVIGHDAGDGNAEACIAAAVSMEEDDGAFLPLAVLDPAEGDARGIDDADVDELPACALASAVGGAAFFPVAGGTVADPLEATELFDVDVDPLAEVLVLVAAQGEHLFDHIGGCGTGIPCGRELRSARLASPSAQ